MSKLGCGCMRLSDIQSEEDGILIIKEAFNKGITYFDTADVYGAHSNELLVGKVVFFVYIIIIIINCNF